VVQRYDVQLLERVQQGYQLIDWVFIYYRSSSIIKTPRHQYNHEKMEGRERNTIKG